MVEADSISVALQRGRESRVAIKLGIAHEGWQKISKEKSAYSGIMSGDRFWQGFSLTLAKKHDIPRIDKVIVGGDGDWLNAGLPALHGRHCDRPWAQVLRTLIYGDTGL